MKILNLLVRLFLCTALILNASCTTTKQEQPVLQEQKVKEEENKIDGKKMAKQATAMVVGDVVIAIICKNGLHLSVGVCLTADVLADVAIIAHSNLGDAEVKQNTDGSKAKLSEKKSKFNPWEFLMGVGLMAITLVWI